MVARGRSLPLFEETLPAQAGDEPPRPPQPSAPLAPRSDSLWLCARFLQLPLEVFARADGSQQAFAVSAGEGSQQRILACNRAAAALGVRPAQSLNSALALAPELLLKPRAQALERAALIRCLNWACQFTPHTHSDFSDHVLLEIHGSLRLFGGLGTLREQVTEGFSGLGYSVCIAAAPTPRAALWLARAGEAVSVTATSDLPARLGKLPLSATGWPEKVCQNLRSLGLQRLGDCLRLPRDGFGRRIGRIYLQELDQALGRSHDPRAAWQPPEHYSGRLELPLPASKHALILHACSRLLRELNGFLRARQAGIRQLHLILEHDDAEPSRCTLHLLQEERDAQHLLELLGERLQREALPAPVVAVQIRSDALQTLTRAPEKLFGQKERRAGMPMTATMLVDRLRSRLGSESVHGLCLVPEHRPESAWQVSEPGCSSAAVAAGERPFWLLERPRPLPVRARRPWLNGPLNIESGPERIETGWWDGKDVARDYFRMRTHSGICLWVFRDRRAGRGWFLHGIFA